MRAGFINSFMHYDVWFEDFNMWTSNIISLVDEGLIKYNPLLEYWQFDFGMFEPVLMSDTDCIIYNDFTARVLSDMDFSDVYYRGVGVNSMLACPREDTIEFDRWIGFDGYDMYEQWLKDLIDDNVIHEYYQTAIFEDEGGQYALSDSGSDLILYSHGAVRVMQQSEFSKHYLEVV